MQKKNSHLAVVTHLPLQMNYLASNLSPKLVMGMPLPTLFTPQTYQFPACFMPWHYHLWNVDKFFFFFLLQPSAVLFYRQLLVAQEEVPLSTSLAPLKLQPGVPADLARSPCAVWSGFFKYFFYFLLLFIFAWWTPRA